eukprot:m.128032 g.128032  ORF g.128032 m.128032 type:complete len:511 (+) comp23575_c0_seq1:33-1565(+)
MSQRQILQVFETYQKARTTFVQTVADLANRSQNAETLQAAGVMSLLRPLLLDAVPSIQQSAALALGRLANVNDELATSIVSSDILPQLVYSLAEQNRFYKKSAAFVLRTVAKHSPELAKAVVDSGALDALVTCLEEFDAGVKENAAWALGYIARHTAELAQDVVDAGAVPLLILCVQEPEISLKRIAASALSDICKHSPELAQTVVDAGAVAYLAQLVDTSDAKLKRQIFAALSQISKHTVELAELVVESEIFPAVFLSLKDSDEYVRKNVATLVREVCKHTAELALLIVNSGGVAAIVDFVSNSSGNSRMPGLMALGFIAAFSEQLAMSVINEGGIEPLAEALRTETQDHIQAAAAWSLGQIGRHTPKHAQHVAESNILRTLLDASQRSSASDDLKNKTNRALKNVVQKCVHLPALEPLLSTSAMEILETVVAQFAKVLPHDAKARRAFVSSGGLKKVQEIQDRSEPLEESIQTINGCYPPEIIAFYSPKFESQILDRVDDYQPASTPA